MKKTTKTKLPPVREKAPAQKRRGLPDQKKAAGDGGLPPLAGHGLLHDVIHDLPADGALDVAKDIALRVDHEGCYNERGTSLRTGI